MSVLILLISAVLGVLVLGCSGENITQNPDINSSGGGDVGGGGPPPPVPENGGAMAGYITFNGQPVSDFFRLSALRDRHQAALQADDASAPTHEVLVIYEAQAATVQRHQVRTHLDGVHGLISRGNCDAFFLDSPLSDRSLTRLYRKQAGVRLVSIAAPARPSFTPSDDRWEQQWDMEMLQMPAAWDIARGSDAVIVAVIDTGIDPEHPDFSGRLLGGYDFISSEVRSFDGGGRDDDPRDDEADTLREISHGTHVAGTIGANAQGIGVVGMDHNCKIMPVRVLSGSYGGSVIDIVEGIIYAADLTDEDLQDFWWFDDLYPNGLPSNRPRPVRRADVINMSLGGGADPFLNRFHIDYYDHVVKAAKNRGVTVVVAAGNDRSTPGHPTEGQIETAVMGLVPALSEHAITVGALNARQVYAGYSNYGPELDIAAPGGSSVQPNSTESIWSCDYSPRRGEGAYAGISGTSMACPHIAGLAALIKGRNSSATPDLIRQIIISNVEDLGAPGFDRDYGHGLARADRALGAATGTSIGDEILTRESLVLLPFGDNAVSFTLYNPAGSMNPLGALSWEATYGGGAGTWISEVRFTNAGDEVTCSVTVSRNGLPEQSRQTAQLTITADTGPVCRTSILLDNVEVPDPGEIPVVTVRLWNWLVSAEDTMREELEMPATYWSFNNIPPASSYITYATTDIDEDGIWDETGEYFGLAEPGFPGVGIEDGQVIEDVHIDLTPIVYPAVDN